MLSLELHKLMNHIVAGEGGRCCGIHGGIPHGIVCSLGAGAHDVTYPP
jgi:hypothetical protein